MLFRVWSEYNKKWETDSCSIDAYGRVLDGWVTVSPEVYKIEFNTGITLADDTETFYGDIIAIKNDYVIGGAEYLVLTESTVWDMVENHYHLFQHPHSFRQFVSLAGNIHETELTDNMKAWIKE